jgi:hypothetical protein
MPLTIITLFTNFAVLIIGLAGLTTIMRTDSKELLLQKTSGFGKPNIQTFLAMELGVQFRSSTSKNKQQITPRSLTADR